MIMKMEQDLSCEDIEVLVKYANMNKNVERIATLLNSIDTRIICTFDGSKKYVNASDIYYIESVDKRTFVYCEESVYKTDSRLYQLVEDLAKSGFVQISKSCLLNINMLDSITSLMNSRMDATLKNGEHLYVTRKYLDNIKEVLQEGV